MNINPFKAAFIKLKDTLQKNTDETDELIEKRELLILEPTAAIDIENEIKRSLDKNIRLAENKIKANLGPLGMGREMKEKNLLTYTKKIDGHIITLVDADILIYLLRDAIYPSIKTLAKSIEGNDAGPPLSERKKLISQFDKDIIEKEEEKNKLHEQVKEAGFTVREDYAIDLENIPKDIATVKTSSLQPNEPVTKLQKLKTSFDMHPNKRIEKRNSGF